MDNNKKPNKVKNPLLLFLLISVVATIILNMVLTSATKPKRTELTYNEFLKMVTDGKVDEVLITAEEYLIYGKPELSDVKIPEASSSFMELFGVSTDEMAKIEKELQKESRKVYFTGYIRDERLLNLLDEHNVTYSTPVEYNNPILSFILSWILPLGIMYLLFFLLTRSMSKRMGGGGGIMGIGQSNAKMYNVEKKTGITFLDVAGQEEAKESLNEIVDFLHNPSKYTAIGAKQPKGALLVGPPGTGKTLLAKAVAGEANVPFFSLSGSEFVEMFVGVGASRVRDLFKQASQKAPCIIFIDEIDAIGKSRDSQLGTNDEREQTLNQLLSEMDGFDSSKGLVILAATNRPEILDKALLRPGRFDRRIIVEKPDLKGREDILKVHIKNVKTSPTVDLHAMALATSGAVGADLANMVNEAALRAVRMGRQEVLQEDLMEAVEIIIAGQEKRNRILSDKEKSMVAFHEVGHALLAALQKNTQPVHKITIVPRTMGALGYTMQMPEEEEHYLMSKDEILDQITVYLAGRAAEELVFNKKTTGASNDIERATELARAMITQYGMSDKFGMAGLESIEHKYLDGRSVSNCSEETKTDVDKEIINILSGCHQKAFDVLKEHRASLDGIAKFLIEKETITGVEFMDILKSIEKTPEEESVAECDVKNPMLNDLEDEINSSDLPSADFTENNNTEV